MTEERKIAARSAMDAYNAKMGSAMGGLCTPRDEWAFLAGAAWGAAARQRFDVEELKALSDQVRAEWCYPILQAAEHIESQQMPEAKA